MGIRKEFEEWNLDLSISPPGPLDDRRSTRIALTKCSSDLIEQRRRVGTDYVEHEVSLARRVGYPLAFLPLLLIVAPFSLGVRRTRSFAESIGLWGRRCRRRIWSRGNISNVGVGKATNPSLGWLGFSCICRSGLVTFGYLPEAQSAKSMSLTNDIDTTV